VNQLLQVAVVAYTNSYVWACGAGVGATAGALCVLVEASSGAEFTRNRFGWERIMSVMHTNSADSVVVNGCTTTGTTTTGTVTNSEVATCAPQNEQLLCAVHSFADTTFLAASYVPYAFKVVYVGMYNVHSSITVVDVRTNTVQSYLFTAYNTKALTISQVRSPPSFVGSMVAGTTVRATAAPATLY